MVGRFKGIAPEIDASCYLAPGCMIIGKVKIGKNSSVWHNTVIRGDIDNIVIGENTNIQDGSVIHCKHDIEVSVGDNVTVGHGVILHSCTVGDNSLIGMGAVILDGVKIGSNCLVAAGSVVTPNSEIPEGSLVLGNPAKIKRLLIEDEIEGIKKNAMEYVRLAADYMKAD